MWLKKKETSWQDKNYDFCSHLGSLRSLALRGRGGEGELERPLPALALTPVPPPLPSPSPESQATQATILPK